MSRNLLYVVQRVLEKLDLDAVNSISDTQDSILIAREAEDTFFDLISRNEWPERHDLLELDSYSDTSLPTALRLPPNVLNVSTIRYDVTVPDTDPNVVVPSIIKNLEQVSPEEFLEILYSRSSDSAEVFVADYKGTPLHIYNNQAPTYYCTFDNETIILDSWIQTVETTVQGFKTVCRGSSVPDWQHEDTFIVPMDVNTFPLYLAEVTASCSTQLNGAQSIEEERRRRLGISRMRRKAFRTDKEVTKNMYGRVGNGVA